MQEMQVRALGPLEKEMGTHYSIPAQRTSMDRRTWKATVDGVAKSQT